MGGRQWLTTVSCERHHSAWHSGQAHLCQPVSWFYHDHNKGATTKLWQRLLFTFLPSHPISPFNSHVTPLVSSHSRGPLCSPRSPSTVLPEWPLQRPVSILTFLFPASCRLPGRGCEARSTCHFASHCVLLAGHLCPCRFSLPGLLHARVPVGSPSHVTFYLFITFQGRHLLLKTLISHFIIFPLHDSKLWRSSSFSRAPLCNTTIPL